MGPVKAALEASARYLAYELGPQGIRVHPVSPGPLKTRAASGLKDFDLLLNEAAARAPLGELVDIMDVGFTCAFLATKYARRLSGETVYVDGKYVPVRDLSEQQLRRYTGSRHWRSKEARASGRFCLQAYCPSWLVKWSKRWQEARPGAFLGMISGIVHDLEAVAPGLSRQLVEAQLHAEAERRRWQEELRQRESEAERQRREVARQEATRDLLRAISSWDEARRVQAYFESVESDLLQLPEEDAAPLRERLRLAKELVEALDPLAQLKDWKAPAERLAGAAKSP
jgi:hypothetical protein